MTTAAPDPVMLAEQSVLGALLLDNAARSKLNGLATEHFDSEAHRATLWRSACRCRVAGRCRTCRAWAMVIRRIGRRTWAAR